MPAHPEVFVSQHRAPRRRADKHPRSDRAASSPSSAAAGRHRAPTHRAAEPGRAAAPADVPPAAPRERRGFTRPSAFLVAGTSALAVAAAGAMNLGAAQAVNSTPQRPLQVLRATITTERPHDLAAGSPSTEGGHDALGSYLGRDGRPATISRSADRAAVHRAQHARLEEAAEQQAAARNKALAALAARAEDRAREIEANMWVLPLQHYDITATFGTGGSLWSSDHTGLDFAAPYGASVQAVAQGVVTQVGYAGAYGNRVIVTHEDGTETWYCHMGSIDVSDGEQVSAGTVVGSVGMTGNTTGPHLHFEVRPHPNVPVDPYSVLTTHGVRP